MGFAVLMFGMHTMSGAVSGLKEQPWFTKVLSSLSNPVLGILVGTVFTAILQSASASVGILQALSATGILSFAEVLPIILGIAIGASVPVLLSGLGSRAHAKADDRTAVAESAENSAPADHPVRRLVALLLGIVLGGGLFAFLLWSILVVFFWRR